MRRLRSSIAIAGLVGALLLAMAAAAQAAPTFPELNGRVVDDAGILSADTRNELTALLAEHERQTGNQVVVATVPSLQGLTIEQYGYQLGRAWGIGQKKKNNGAILLVSPNTRDVRIEVGYGLEGTLTDLQSKLIIQNVILPAFRRNDFNAGVLSGTITLLQALGGHPSAKTVAWPEPEVDPNASDDGGGFHIPVILIIIVLWLLFGRFFWPLFFLGGLGGRSWGGGGGFGGGGFGGGGFSGGGGSFGGGGASGHW